MSERALLATALADVRGMLSTLTGHVAAAGCEPAPRTGPASTPSAC